MSFKLKYPSILFRFPRWAAIKSVAQDMPRYKLGESEIVWEREGAVKPLPLSNHVEMSGLQSSLLFSYRVDSDYSIKRFVYGIFPQLRIFPNDTHSSLGYIFKHIKISAEGAEIADKITFNGILTIHSHIGNIAISRAITAARDAMAVVEKITLTNTGNTDASATITVPRTVGRVAKVFCHGDNSYDMYTTMQGGMVTSSRGDNVTNKSSSTAESNVSERQCSISANGGVATLKVGECVTCYAVYSAESDKIDGASEYACREKFLVDISNKLTITTPSAEINQMLQFTKLRASESIFKTKGGLMHAPGGGGFYAAMWTNDQCEYANPYFAYAGYDIAKQSAVNSYEWFGKFVRPDKTIVSSVIAGGDGIWQGVGDRGDNAMYVYGLARYIMTTGDEQLASEYLDRLTVAIEFTIGKINSDGVVTSDSDELENRFESGSANLSTSAIAYDAILSMGYLLDDMGLAVQAARYIDISSKLRASIERYFGATVDGYKTYRYCAEEKALRSWICIPLTVNIYDRASESVKAIMSDKLRSGNGILTRSGEKTYWDRSALYALRGMFLAGQADTALSLLAEYSADRLLGEHVPYPVEAFPEGNGAHLSAESALYQRIFIEGTLGYRPIGFKSFQLMPNLPTSWDYVNVANIELSGKPYDIATNRDDDKYNVVITDKQNGSATSHSIKCGEMIIINL